MKNNSSQYQNINNTKLSHKTEHNSVSFFNLLLKVALRKKIDIGQFKNRENKPNKK